MKIPRGWVAREWLLRVRYESMSWWEYVQRVTRRGSQHEIARRIGISPSSVNRWKTSDPKPESVRALAVEYGRPVQEAFVAAGYLQPEDVDETSQHASVPLSVEEAAEKIWSLKGLPEETRRLLILELMERSGREDAAQTG
ncbi:MAG TPA: helix-turn-helix transcriptional regulator [Actinopolymorphaceae bacterium]|nr:helix-turn-helix transcriptional regulator [Actinopolymorphaceae bacterium]